MPLLLDGLKRRKSPSKAIDFLDAKARATKNLLRAEDACLARLAGYACRFPKVGRTHLVKGRPYTFLQHA
jgi:hypothetical protein